MPEPDHILTDIQPYYQKYALPHELADIFCGFRVVKEALLVDLCVDRLHKTLSQASEAV